RGLNSIPLEVPSGRSPEPIQKTIRDGVRAVIWLTTGYTGASLGDR
ncbi:MAG: YdcF family protein, partial [Okeania sp. SIO2H7]|nr:YdcF family protein [Okeania sp. SIO2H7]